MRFRKTEMVRAVDLREKRKAAGLTADEFAEVLEVSDGKHVSAIEIGKCAITITKAAKAAYRLGAVVVEVEGVGLVAVVPTKEKTRPVVTNLRPGEAAWIAIEENRESLESLEQIQKAILDRDRERLVKLYEQVVCDTQHAAELVATTLDRYDPTIGIEARMNHRRKLIAKGVFVDEAA